MDLKELQKNWNELAKADPLWAIRAWPSKIGNRWKIDEFFETGVKEIDATIRYVEALGIKLQRRKALDFGCGIGRLTQSLCKYFDEVCGVDIAPSMIRLAKEYNQYGNRCTYHLNTKENLEVFRDDEFNFIYSALTLQHIEPQYSKNYIKEFLRVLTPDGLVVFELPSDPLRIVKHLVKAAEILTSLYFRARYSAHARMETYWMKPEIVTDFVKENRGRIIAIEQGEISDKRAGGIFWKSYRYFVMKE